MSSRPSGARRTEPGRSRRRAGGVGLLVALLLGPWLVACNNDDDGESLLGDAPTSMSPATATSLEQRALNRRVRAVRDGDERAFLRGVDHADRALVARQRRWFRNVVQLPLEKLSYEVLREQWTGLPTDPKWGQDLRVPRVQLTMQLQGYDAEPVRRTVGFVFAFRHGRAVIVSDRTVDGRPLGAGTPAPWDLTAITVRRRAGVLGIFDNRTRGSAATVMQVVARGITQLDRALPFTWDDRVVVYHFATPRVLASFTDVPGGAITHLGAMTFPEYATDDRRQLASTRMLLMRSSVEAGQPFLGRITRHELSHVAVGSRDDGAPTWLSEGVAEYLGAREIPLKQRIIPTSALGRATTEDAGLPASASFNDSDQEWHYALAWMACDYIADSQGESRLWELVDAMHDGGRGTTDQRQDVVLRRVLGYDGRELARRAEARIRAIYG